MAALVETAAGMTGGQAADANAMRRLRYGLLFATLASVLFTYGESLSSMYRIWSTSDTYAHGILIAPISAYLIYQLRDTLARVPMETCWLALLPLIGAGAVWMLAMLVDIQVFQQFMLVTIVISLSLLFLGWQWFRAVMFPLCFLYLMVPLGDGLVPYLVDRTADFVVIALRVTGIPVYREGNFFVIPSGTWSVVSGCSGMRYLMATLTIGVLFAYLNYRSAWRRIVFVGIALAVAVVGNWLRAYGIVMIAHLSDMKLALGVDHIIYGWVFFGLLIFTLMAIGVAWSEDAAQVPTGPTDPGQGSAATRDMHTGGRRGALVTLLVGLLAVQAWPGLARVAALPVPYADPAMEPPRLPAGWSPVAQAFSPAWTPRFVGHDRLLHASYRGDGGVVGWYVAWYAAQKQGAEVINAANHLVHEKYAPWRVYRTGTETRTGLPFGAVMRTYLKERGGSQEILIWQWYWIAGHSTASRLAAKVYESIARLSGLGSPGAGIVLYTLIQPDETTAAAEARLREFAGTASVTLDALLSDVPRAARAQDR